MNPATMLTLSRLVVAPLFAALFLAGYRPPGSAALLWASVVCLVLIELSDAFDGYVARKRSEVTNFGKIFDPICDGLSRQTVFVAFTVAGIIPLWMFLIFLYRDGLMSFMRIMCAAEGTVVAARTAGKLKAILQAVSSFVVLAVVLARVHGVPGIPHTLWDHHPGFWIMLPAAAFTILSAIDYLGPAVPMLRRQMQPGKSG